MTPQVYNCLGDILKAHDISLREFSRETRIPQTTAHRAQMGYWAKSRGPEQKRKAAQYLSRVTPLNESQIMGVLDKPDSLKMCSAYVPPDTLGNLTPIPQGYGKPDLPDPKTPFFENPLNPIKTKNPIRGESSIMLLSKQTLYPDTRRHFSIQRDPFNDDVNGAEDVFLSKPLRYVRETMWQTAKHSGLLTVVGESGSGKSTLRRDMIDRVQRERAKVIVIEPYVIAMEANDQRGKMLKSSDVVLSIIHSLNPMVPVKNSSEARFQQMHKMLRDSAASGYHHVVIIEEAHSLPTSTLTHFKRFFDLERGFSRLVSFILIGHPELRTMLNEKFADLREIIQRMEIIDLPALGNDLDEYVAFKFRRVGLDVNDIFEPDAISTLRDKLTQEIRVGGMRRTESFCYPLVVANSITAALNSAAEIGLEKVSAEIFEEQ